MVNQLIKILLFVHVVRFSGNVLSWQCLLVRHSGYFVVVWNPKSIVRVFASEAIHDFLLF